MARETLGLGGLSESQNLPVASIAGPLPNLDQFVHFRTDPKSPGIGRYLENTSPMLFVLLLWSRFLQCDAVRNADSRRDTGFATKRENLNFWDRKGNADSASCDHKVDCCQGE